MAMEVLEETLVFFSFEATATKAAQNPTDARTFSNIQISAETWQRSGGFGRPDQPTSRSQSQCKVPPSTPEAKWIGSPLPPLERQILQRPRLLLDVNGLPTISTEQLIRLHEVEEPEAPINALQLAVFPKRCLDGDEIALMPCHSMQHRGFAQLAGEQWREPLRDRDKQWVKNELKALLNSLQQRQTPMWGMTRAPGTNNRGKWARYASASPAKGSKRILLSTRGALISRSYCVVSIFGEGIHGRLYGAGLTGKPTERCLHVEAYEPSSSRTFCLRVTLQDIEEVFRVGDNDPDRAALLAPGKKQEMLRQLVELLFFEYPDDPSEESNIRLAGLPILRLSADVQLNEAAIRRLEREEQLRQEEARRLEDLAALLATPRRARHRVLCQQMKLRGRSFFVSVHHFPAQARNLVITAYNPSSSITFRLTVGLLEATSLVKLYPLPRGGFSSEQTLTVARGLLRQLRILGREDSRTNARMTLAIDGGRKGPGMTALPALVPMLIDEQRRENLVKKMQRDGQHSLQIESAITQRQLHDDAEVERVEVRQKIVAIEAKHAELLEKDQALKTRIEEIDALGGGGGTGIDMKRLHEERRTHKTARQALKTEMKPATQQLAELKKQLQSISEKEKAAVERVQRRADRARKRIREEVHRKVTDATTQVVQLKKQYPVGQRTYLSRVHMQPSKNLVASGCCRISGKRVRYSLYSVESEAADIDEVHTDANLFKLELYDSSTCTWSDTLVVSKLELLALTKQHHDQQLLVPELAPMSSDVIKRLDEVQKSIAETRHALLSLSSKPSAKKNSSNKDKLAELKAAMTAASSELYSLYHNAPWPLLAKSLCERITISSPSDAAAFPISLDRCIFQSVSPILCVKMEDDDAGSEDDEDSNLIQCQVRVEVLPLAEAVVFNVSDPLTETRWRLEYPESRELFREFTIETFVEMQMHLEAIVMTLLLQSNATTGQLELRFEE